MLYKAIYAQNYILAHELLKAGANPNIMPSNLRPPLILAVMANNAPLTIALLESGANPNSQNSIGL